LQFVEALFLVVDFQMLPIFFSAEAKAILLALNYIEFTFHNHFVIFSDSKSVLQAIKNRNWKNPIICQILQKFDLLYNTNKRIILFWIPSHIGIPGNDKADSAAKKALNNNISNTLLPFSDFKQNCSIYILSLWQTLWNLDNCNKLLSIKP
ncbi:ribonuclease H family protein, partial [Salmonella sp. s51944]|uniref:ribonuclease H family protein n=1 Tax=Salmonella sp. s51944 TaxID=3159655 RepID=UPI00398026D5